MIFDVRDLWRALRHFPTMITAVDNEGEKVGVIANTLNSVSNDQAQLFLSIDKNAYTGKTKNAG